MFKLTRMKQGRANAPDPVRIAGRYTAKGLCGQRAGTFGDLPR